MSKESPRGLVDALFRWFAPKEENVIWVLIERRMRKRMTGKVLVALSLICVILPLFKASVIIPAITSTLLLSWSLQSPRNLTSELKRHGVFEDLVFLAPIGIDDFPKAFLRSWMISQVYSLIPWFLFMGTAMLVGAITTEQIATACIVLTFLSVAIGCEYFRSLRPRDGWQGCLSNFVLFVFALPFLIIITAAPAGILYTLGQGQQSYYVNLTTTLASFLVGCTVTFGLFAILIAQSYYYCTEQYLMNLRDTYDSR